MGDDLVTEAVDHRREVHLSVPALTSVMSVSHFWTLGREVPVDEIGEPRRLCPSWNYTCVAGHVPTSPSSAMILTTFLRYAGLEHRLDPAVPVPALESANALATLCPESGVLVVTSRAWW